MVGGKRAAAHVVMDEAATAEIEQRRKKREGRVLRLAKAQLQRASAEIVEERPKDARWFCLQVQSGFDFVVEKLFSECGVEVLAPREKVTLRRRGKQINRERAYFSGYVLARFVPSPEAFDGVRKQKGIFGIVTGCNGYLIVRDEEVRRFQRLAPGSVSRMATDKTIAEGSEAVITYGPFAGMKCVVLAVKWSREARVRVRIVYDGNPFEIADMPLAFLKKL